MADTREFSSSMSTPQSGSANLDITINGTTTNYNPFGPDRSVTIPSNGINVFIDSPVGLESITIGTAYDEGSAGRAKYLRCMEILGNGVLPVCTGRNRGSAGTHGSFAPLSYITDDCELVFIFIGKTDGSSLIRLRLNAAGVWHWIK